jgi:hypothetical protein
MCGTAAGPHHILSCYTLVYGDATHPYLFSLFVTLLLDAQDPRGLVPRPISVRITLEPYNMSCSQKLCIIVGCVPLKEVMCCQVCLALVS